MNATENSCAPVAQTPTVGLLQAVSALAGVHARFAAREIKPVEHADLREPCLANALRDLASIFDVTLQLPLQIDSLGEFSIVAMPKDGSSPRYGCGPFGEFAAVLSGYRPRTGTAPCSSLSPQGGWCRMNHFDVERMVTEQAAARAS
jgi:hypothetical protein